MLQLVYSARSSELGDNDSYIDPKQTLGAVGIDGRRAENNEAVSMDVRGCSFTYNAQDNSYGFYTLINISTFVWFRSQSCE